MIATASNRPAVASQAATTAQAPAKPKRKRVRIKTERRREQCRLNQARYRDKQRAAVMDLEDTVEELQRHVRRLERQRSLLRRAIDSRDAAVKTVVTYFTLFRYGVEAADGYMVATQSAARRLEQQHTFLHAVLAPDVLVNNMRGRDVFVDQTGRFTTLFGQFEQQLEHLHPVQTVEGSKMFLANVRLGLTITPATMRFVFPHIKRHDPITRKLVGSRISCAVSASFEFDDSSRIVRTEWNIDFVGAFLRLLSLEETSAVVQRARVANNAMLVDDATTFDPPAPSPVNNNMQTRRMIVMDSTADESWRRGEAPSDCELLLHDGLGDDFVMV
ncbi:hypothetical protein P43SY_009249 [Pythium insidiosum]|uniref:BZIP domain-containing protein n=1 Tax=Pythium insidiosum TaxID=114742 RepID=A0AAD5Q7J6_PYTIN|nr:hypothetical protein P43SY_009249 [Pythium insidiosum]